MLILFEIIRACPLLLFYSEIHCEQILFATGDQQQLITAIFSEFELTSAFFMKTGSIEVNFV